MPAGIAVTSGESRSQRKKYHRPGGPFLAVRQRAEAVASFYATFYANIVAARSFPRIRTADRVSVCGSAACGDSDVGRGRKP
jgi:hypothetical protein